MTALYEEILRISREYMGIVAESFVRRRCKNSLDLDDPRRVEPRHIELFAQGVVQTGEVYMKAEKVKEFATQLMRLREKYMHEPDEGGDYRSEHS